MMSPNARNIVVTKSKYGPAAIPWTRTSSVNCRRKDMAYGRTK